MTTYVAIISKPAHAIDSTVSAHTYAVIEQEEPDAVFKYIDTASSRAGISVVTDKLALDRIAIVGLGGTGSYVLDLVAKTPVSEIHLFDGDKFLSHNAFRAPGAPSIDDLRLKPMKTDYFREQYSAMRRNIIAHTSYIDASNVDQLQKMDFVFLCMDSGGAKKLIIASLEESSIPFIDVGMGIQLIDDSLLGILRVTSSTSAKRDHLRKMGRIHFTDEVGNNEYDTNIQVADLNALNAALAVIKWKKIFGFYVDIDKEHHSTYTIDGNLLINEDMP
jgi:tRNA A37 threonylcarbamoyladenosine dehydratase